jgi:hypothetical protein
MIPAGELELAKSIRAEFNRLRSKDAASGADLKKLAERAGNKTVGSSTDATRGDLHRAILRIEMNQAEGKDTFAAWTEASQLIEEWIEIAGG